MALLFATGWALVIIVGSGSLDQVSAGHDLSFVLICGGWHPEGRLHEALASICTGAYR